jgi:hypothetical protein
MSPALFGNGSNLWVKRAAKARRSAAPFVASCEAKDSIPELCLAKTPLSGIFFAF